MNSMNSVNGVVLESLRTLRKGLSNGRVHIKNMKNLNNKLKQFVKMGPEHLQVVSDFDRTFSKYAHNGRPNPTCYGIFESDPELTDAVKKKLIDLKEKYYPIEIDSNMTEAQKIPFMIEWWKGGHDVMIDARLHRQLLLKTCMNSDLKLKDGVHKFVENLKNNDVPLLIFSAGLGNVIEPILEREKICFDNVHVISNFMDFNDEGLLVGFQEPLIHVFNKTAASISDTDYYINVSSKKPCILLLGDSTGDVHMSDGATVMQTECIPNYDNLSDDKAVSTVIRVGFLNEKVDEKLETYKDLYDIVLLGDETFDVAADIVDAVINRCPPV